MTNSRDDSSGFEAEVTAMLHRRARDVDTAAASRLGHVAVKKPAHRRRLLVGATAACVVLVAALLAVVSLRPENDVTSVVSQPDDAVSTPIQSQPAMQDVENNCDPATTSSEAIALVCRGVGAVHTIVAGDTLSQLAQTFGVTVDSILQANPGLRPDSLMIGDQLVIPPSLMPNAMCPREFPVGQDTTGDGVIDTCFPDAHNSADGPQPTTQDEPVSAVWLEDRLDADPPASLKLTALGIEASRYSALVTQAQNDLRSECLRDAGFEAVDIDLFAERSIQSGPPDFELAPFSVDGGYALAASRGGSDSTLGPIANALMVQQASYVDSLTDEVRSQYEQVFDRCLAEATTSIFDGPVTSVEFYDLVNIGINLQSALTDLVSEHPVAQSQQTAWQLCMQDEGHEVNSRLDALQDALDERYASGQTAAAEPGPVELGLAGADRRCSASLGYNQDRATALGAAEQYLLTHDPEVMGFVTSWTSATTHLRPKLEQLLEPELVAQLIPASSVNDTDIAGTADHHLAPMGDEVVYLPDGDWELTGYVSDTTSPARSGSEGSQLRMGTAELGLFGPAVWAHFNPGVDRIEYGPPGGRTTTTPAGTEVRVAYSISEASPLAIMLVEGGSAVVNGYDITEAELLQIVDTIELIDGALIWNGKALPRDLVPLPQETLVPDIGQYTLQQRDAAGEPFRAVTVMTFPSATWQIALNARTSHPDWNFFKLDGHRAIVYGYSPDSRDDAGAIFVIHDTLYQLRLQRWGPQDPHPTSNDVQEILFEVEAIPLAVIADELGLVTRKDLYTDWLDDIELPANANIDWLLTDTFTNIEQEAFFAHQVFTCLWAGEWIATGDQTALDTIDTASTWPTTTIIATTRGAAEGAQIFLPNPTIENPDATTPAGRVSDALRADCGFVLGDDL